MFWGLTETRKDVDCLLNDSPIETTERNERKNKNMENAAQIEHVHEINDGGQVSASNGCTI